MMTRLIPLLCLCATPLTAQDTEELALARATLSAIQPQSIRENVEYCGYLGLDENGAYIASPPTRGDTSSCLSDDPVDIAVITASYHTHAAYSPDYNSEVPSGDDIEGDEEEGIDGYVATPGGRFWYIDTLDDVLSQICGVGCLPHDPSFERETDYVVQQSYAFDELIEATGQ